MLQLLPLDITRTDKSRNNIQGAEKSPVHMRKKGAAFTVLEVGIVLYIKHFTRDT